MTKRFHLLFLLLIISTTISFAQDDIMAIRQSREQAFSFIDRNGDLLFKLPVGHEPTVRANKEPFKLGNFYFIDFSSGVLPVTDGITYYLINKKGERIKEMGSNINWISRYENGFFRVFDRYNNQRNSSMIIYHDLQGNPVFDGKKFWQASRFRKGKALVQLTDREGDWLMIDSTGQTVFNLSDSIPGQILRITKFDKGIWKLSVKFDKRYSSMYVNTDGQFSKKETDLWLPKFKKRKNTFKSDERIARRINKMEGWVFPPVYSDKNKAFYIFNDAEKGASEDKPVLYNHHYEVVSLPMKRGIKKLTPIDFRGEFLIAHQITEKMDSSFVFYHLDDLKKRYEIKELSRNIGVEKGLLLFSKKTTFSTTVHKIVNLNSGKVIYEPGVKEIVFKSLKAALANKAEVRQLDLTGISNKELLQLHQFKSLEVLKLKELNSTMIPEAIFTTLPKLRHLSILDSKKLTKIPDDLTALSQLHFLYISDCPNLPKPLELLYKMPGLKVFRNDYPFTKQEIETIEQKCPELGLEFVLEAVEMKE